MKPWLRLLTICLGWWSAGLAQTTPERLFMAAPELHNVPSEEAEAIGHALRFHLQQKHFQLQDTSDTRSAWTLHWSVTRLDSLLYLSLRLQPSAETPVLPRQLQTAWPLGQSYYLPARDAVQSLLNADTELPAAQLPPEKSSRPWISGLVWGGFAGVAFWQQQSLTRPSRTHASSAGKGASDIAALFAGNPPLPALRGSAGAGSAQYGQSRSHFLNPAGVAYTPDQVEVAAGKLPGGTTETGAVFTGTLGNGWWQAHSLRFEGDSLASAWLFASSLASDLGYWFSGLQGIYAGMTLKGSSMAAGDATSASAVSGSGIGWGVDAGLQWRLSPQIRMGVSLLDMVAMDRWHNLSTRQRYWEKRPLRCLAGLAWSSPYDATLLLDWQQGVGNEAQEIIALAVERTAWQHFVWRVGYRHWLDQAADSWHAGLGAHMSAGSMALHIEYSIEAPGQTGGFSAVRQTAGTRLAF